MTALITLIIFIIGAHYIADFPLQSEFLAMNKGKKWYLLFAHAMIYTTTISITLLLLGVYADWKFAVLLISHYFIDRWKSHEPADEAHWHLIYYDQALHLLINILLVVV